MGIEFNAEDFTKSLGFDYELYREEILKSKPQVSDCIKKATLKDSSRLHSYPQRIGILTGIHADRLSDVLVSQLIWQSLPESKQYPLHISPGFDAGRMLFYYPQSKRNYLFSIYAVGWGSEEMIKGFDGNDAPFKVRFEEVQMKDRKNCDFASFNFDSAKPTNVVTESHKNPLDALRSFYTLTHELAKRDGDDVEVHMLERNNQQYGSVFSSPSLRDNLAVLAYAYSDRNHLKGPAFRYPRPNHTTKLQAGGVPLSVVVPDGMARPLIKQPI
jgi:hypothetical protein